MRCNRCHRPMRGSTAYDGACECGGLIERYDNDMVEVGRLSKDTGTLPPRRQDDGSEPSLRMVR